ncbi:MAG: matrixin family metalloprotease [Tateyamaria sp.]
MMSVVLHEVGHCIGLAHSTESTAVMYEGIELGTAKRAITSDDKAGRDSLYK